MDVGAFVQENKRWLIGCAIGGVVYLIANIVITSIYDADSEERAASGLIKSVSKMEVYGQPALEAARAEGEALKKEKQRLQEELAFTQKPRFQLAGNGAPEEYLFQVGRKVKQALLDATDARDIQLADKDVSWPSANGVEEIRGVLFGLELLDEAAQRLLAAHEAVRTANPEAMGLRAIVQLKIDERRGQRSQARMARPGEVDLHDYLVQERVTFQFQSDAATFMAFFEACRQPGRTLTLENVQIQSPQKAGDPVLVKGSLQGIAFKEAK